MFVYIIWMFFSPSAPSAPNQHWHQPQEQMFIGGRCGWNTPGNKSLVFLELRLQRKKAQDRKEGICVTKTQTSGSTSLECTHAETLIVLQSTWCPLPRVFKSQASCFFVSTHSTVHPHPLWVLYLWIHPLTKRSVTSESILVAHLHILKGRKTLDSLPTLISSWGETR